MGNPDRFAGGRTVADLLEVHRIPANIATYILSECAKALKEAAEQGKIHQNIKPANILVSSTGRVQLTKFNTDTGTSSPSSFLKSAIPYVAPERHSGASPSASTDIFALGATFFEILVGEPAFSGGSGQDIKERVLDYDPTPELHEEDHVHTQLRRICQQMLRKKPQQRYQGYNVLLADLEAYKKNRGIEAIGSAAEMKRFFSNPEGYVSPERGHAARTRASVRAKSERSAAPKKVAKNPETKQPPLSKWFVIVGVFVLLFSGLSLAGNFFFSKDGKWGGSGNSPGASAPSERTSSTVTTRRGKGKGNASVQASGTSAVQQNASSVTVEGESDPVEIVDQSNEEETTPEENEPQEVKAASLAGVDTVIILPNEADTRTGRLMIKAEPEATVFFDNDSLGTTPLPVVTNPGTYKVVLKAPGFPAFETLVDVIPNRETPLEVSLWILVGRLDLSITPAAEVFINDERVRASVANESIPVLPGRHRLRMVHPELGTFESEVEIKSGEQHVLRFDLRDM